MHFIVKVFPEIIIKSPPVRKRFIKQLRDNLRRLLQPLSEDIQVKRDWEKVEVQAPGADERLTRQVADVLARTPGIDAFALVQAYPLGDLDDILAKTRARWAEALAGKTFCVRVKRSGKHDFSSTDIERYVGGGLLQQTQAAGVKLRDPDITVRLEVKRQWLFVLENLRRGLGGYPLGAQNDGVLSLVSGGFDSIVASYLTMKRGMRTHFCFFSLGGHAHEMAVKEVSYYLWQKYGASHNVQFVTVPFEGVVAEILEKVDNAYMGVILKRMMLRAASRVAEELDLKALVTGESVAQVSSQTIPNLNAIDRATDTLVLRPLIAMDKRDIIQLSRDIGTETYSANVPEYCGVISVRPTTNAKLHRVESEEARFDFTVLERALEDRAQTPIHHLVDAGETELDVAVEPQVGEGDVVIDIRHPDEAGLKPLALTADQLLEIPFFRLNGQFGKLDPQRRYLLYCEKGVMSQLHAAHLMDAGHRNIGVYRPE
ncbi:MULTISPECIES: tRNA uracil 4-sulfurtransferase ThiI [unclassified Marinimicrobium]|jgi:thiamine biosynthesis protein ThiI|uniref:tRNA uracil 4-sulfurtransferase ThiI n=1 Tax=unclassified Marinimicrobium TaxID=2632100 RepID=UPI000C51B864|nr:MULTISPECIES: tRNA uracil 4-sulfurtransferase ThiI [unclassified Marinimicrobium]MAN50731.1 tRNA 4-thiouridine(8) synthase ThiI [Marinimicrobium sp.]